MITVTTPCQDVKPNTFMIEGKYTESVNGQDVNECAFLCMFYAKRPLP